MLSFNRLTKNDREVAIVKGGDNDEKIIYYISQDTINNNKFNNGKQKRVLNLKKLRMKLCEEGIDDVDYNIQKVKRNYYTNSKPLRKSKCYDIANNLEDASDEIELYDEGEIIPIPSKKERDIIYISGPSGSGKSTFCNMYGRMFLNLHPKHKIRLFSKLTKDPSIDKLKPIRFNIDEELVTNPIQISEIDGNSDLELGECITPNKLAQDPTPEEEGEEEEVEIKKKSRSSGDGTSPPPTLVIFDDIDTTRDKQVKKALYDLQQDLLETGRHNNVYVMITTHMLTNYKETRNILNECSAIVVFPNTNNKQIEYVLKTYVMLDKESIKKILNLPSRWVMIRKNMPRMVLYSKGVYLLK